MKERAQSAHFAPERRGGPVLITGGAGFIGINLAHRLLWHSRPVLLFDNLSRPGVEKNWDWLRSMHGNHVQIQVADVRDRFALRSALREASQVFHLAAQVSVPQSLADPVADFEVNARGTVNLLEEIRGLAAPPPLVFASSNKVYGSLEDLKLGREGGRYIPEDSIYRTAGISEKRPLTFQSPYACSTGAADQYVLDYARLYGLRAVVFRMSCIYGLRQFATEDQGWIAHFIMQAIAGRPVTIYGDGMQVRDVLWVQDLVEAFLLAETFMSTVGGRAFNIGGGPPNTISLLELVELIGELHGRKPRICFESWRAADQRYYVSDIRAFQAATGWSPRTQVRQGIEKLYRWLLEFRALASAPVHAGIGAA